MKRLRRILALRAYAKTARKQRQQTLEARERGSDLKFARQQYAAYCRGEGEFNG